jgi:CheY-like chemotaxis protein/anti-sigma regulatory factor (Ser/Thr protein kinase)
VTSLLDLVNDLLDLSRFDSGKVDLIETEFPLNDLIEGEGQQFRPAALAHGLDLIVEPLNRPVWLRTDRVKLARVVGNLIDNAIKFTAAGSVRVSAELVSDPERRVLIRVADTGIGIPEEQHARIFDEFQQLRNPERDRAKGSGLGLAISKRLVDLLGGHLRVESDSGRGTVFTLEMPASAIAVRLEAPSVPGPLREARTAPASPRLPGLRVLLVEDHADTRTAMREILVHEGARIDEAADGASAMERIGQSEYDVILLDLMLPDMSGTDILRALTDHRPPGLKGVLVLTGDSRQHDRMVQLGIHPDALLQKPVDLDVLVNALRIVQRHRPGTDEA